MSADHTTPWGTTPVAGPALDGGRYSRIAMALHWTIAVLILGQIVLGWYMNEWIPDHTPYQDQVEGLHIELGLTILLLILVRIGVRLAIKPPPLPAGMPAWETGLAHAAHLLFYLLMIAMPLTGWALVSAGPDPISFWGITWPHLPGVGFMTGPEHKPTRHLMMTIHTTVLIWIVLLNLALHVAGAIKHQFDGRPVLWRMAPWLKK